MKNTIFIILNSRIKTVDTIIPILMELDQRKVEILFYSPSTLTTQTIIENKVIFECVNLVGKIINYCQNKNHMEKIQNAIL